MKCKLFELVELSILNSEIIAQKAKKATQLPRDCIAWESKKY